MVSCIAVVKNPLGLHARPAGVFVKTARSFQSQVKVVNRKNGLRADAKSIIQLLSLSLVQGTEIEILAEGTDEELALEALQELLEHHLNEEE